MVGEECWCSHSKTTLPSDVCGHPKEYGGRYYSIGKQGTDSLHEPSAIITAVGKKPSSRCSNSQDGCGGDCATNRCNNNNECSGSTMECWDHKRRWKRKGSAGIVRCANLEGKYF